MFWPQFWPAASVIPSLPAAAKRSEKSLLVFWAISSTHRTRFLVGTVTDSASRTQKGTPLPTVHASPFIRDFAERGHVVEMPDIFTFSQLGQIGRNQFDGGT
jgi:hypothetical protein